MWPRDFLPVFIFKYQKAALTGVAQSIEHTPSCAPGDHPSDSWSSIRPDCGSVPSRGMQDAGDLRFSLCSTLSKNQNIS